MIWQNILLSYVSLFALGLADNIRGPIYPEIIKTFSLSNSVGAAVFACSSFMSLLGGFHTPWLMKRWSLYRILTFSLFCLALGVFIMSISPNFGILLIGAAFLGYSFGPLGISQNALLVQGTVPETRVRWMSGLHSLYGLASFFAPLIVAMVADWSSPWRWSLGWSSLMIAIVMIVSVIVKSPAHKRDVVPRQDGYSFTRREWHLAMVFAFYVAAELLVGTRLAQYLRLENGADLRSSSYAVTGFYLGMLAGRVIAVFFHIPWKLKNAMLTSLALTLVCMVLGLWLHPYFLVLTGLTMSPFYAWAMTYLAEVFHMSVERAISLIITLDALFIVSMHLSVGQITDALGIWWAMILAPILIIASFSFLWTFKNET